MDNELKAKITQYNQQYKERDALYRVAALKAGMPESAYWILYIICESPDTMFSQSDICREWLYPKQTVNSGIAKLIRSNLITLSPDPHNKNRKVLCLTEQGERYCEEWVKPVIDADNASFAGLTKEEQELCIQLTQKQLDTFKQAMQCFLNKPM